MGFKYVIWWAGSEEALHATFSYSPWFPSSVYQEVTVPWRVGLRKSGCWKAGAAYWTSTTRGNFHTSLSWNSRYRDAAQRKLRGTEIQLENNLDISLFMPIKVQRPHSSKLIHFKSGFIQEKGSTCPKVNGWGGHMMCQTEKLFFSNATSSFYLILSPYT